MLRELLELEHNRNDVFKLGVGMEDVRHDVEKKALEAFGVEEGGLGEKWCGGVGEGAKINVSLQM